MTPNDLAGGSGAPQPSAGATPPFDELIDAHGQVRPHWRSVIGAFAGMPPAELLARAARLDRAFADEGISTALPHEPGRLPEHLP